jgi:GNAT superfamily N-acetyltransferase
MTGSVFEKMDSRMTHEAKEGDIAIGCLHVYEVARATRLLARAFAEDPIITHYLHDPVRRAVALPAFFEAVLEELLPSNEVLAARSADELLGVAAWLPPQPAEPDDAARARAAQAQRIVRTMFPLTSTDLYDGFAALETLHPQDPHWYLAFVGVEPKFQGRGIGRALLAPVLNVADETGALCYLETPFPETHRYYDALGFVRHAEHHTFRDAPQGVVAFLRKPGGSWSQ